VNDYDPLGHMTNAEFAAQKRAAKRMRKFVRKVVRADLQRRAITGEPSPFKRADA
jgi:hypothetical protein